MKYDAFISYRRESGTHQATALKEALENRGHKGRIFMDVFNDEGGPFPKKLSDALKKSCNLIVIISSKDCFKPKENEEDWFLREISDALEQDKNIIPVFYDEIKDKDIESDLSLLRNSPYKIKNLPKHQAVFFHGDIPEASFNQANSYLKSEENVLNEQFKLLSNKKNQIHQGLLEIRDINTIKCPICGTDNDVALSYCNICAYKFFDEVEESVADKNEKKQENNRIKKHSEIWKGYCEQGKQQENIKNLQDTISDLEKSLATAQRDLRLTDNNPPHKEENDFFVIKLNEKVEFKMIRVEGGTFMMGATKEQGSKADDDEQPAHEVTLSDFYIGETQVTQELWNAVMDMDEESNPSKFKGAKRPQECVSWNDCQEFIQRLNDKTNKNFRMPTEAEWEYAARGGKKSMGYKYAGSNSIGDVAWYGENSNKHTHDVHFMEPNELGLYDMSGNVWEWCSDWYGEYGKSSQTNPRGPSFGSNRVSRGGSWRSNAGLCRVSLRGYYAPDFHYFNLGLRLAQ